MKRTFNPIMEVIRFTTEDVIVTSGVSTVSKPITYSSSFVNRNYYATTSSELQQGGYDNTGSTWYIYQFKPNKEPKFQSLEPWDRDKSEYDYIYTWFAESESQWKVAPFLTKQSDSLPTN